MKIMKRQMHFGWILAILPVTKAFFISFPIIQQQQRHHSYSSFQRPYSIKKNVFFLLQMTSSTSQQTPPNFSSTDPFQILGIAPTADAQAIKRAYKKLAFQYHPDMVTTKDSTTEEKRIASDRFAKINAAYETLSGKTGRNGSTTTTTTTTTSSSSSTTNGWTPPHRRTSTSSSSSSSNTNWRDYIPYTTSEDEKYDAGGDSFGAIFADLLAGASSSRGGGGGGVVRDFIEFLEQTVDAYSTSSTSYSTSTTTSKDNDADLQFLLQAGTIRQVGDEMDETELVLQQLNKKMQQIDIELIELQTELASSSKFTQKMELEESLEELRARKRVVENYIQKARKRLLALQTRYKELVVQGANDPKAGGTDRSAKGSTSPPPPPPPSSSPYFNKNAENASWKDESFGSFGRGRGSSRRRAQRNTASESSTTTTTANASSSSASYDATNFSNSNSSSYQAAKRNYSSSPASDVNSSTYVPPHRRTQTTSSTQDDKRRLRELKVDEEFEKMKRELGL